jgi:S-formylglutathione hydrolase FrmB
MPNPVATRAKGVTTRQVGAGLASARLTAWGAVRRRPPVVTLVLIVCICVTFARLEVGLQLPTLRFVSDAFSPRAVIEGRYGTVGTAAVLTRDVFMVVSICVSLLATMGVYEVLAGHLRATLLAVFAAVVAPMSVTVGLLALDVFGSSWAQGRLETLDIGASAIVSASSGAIAGIVRDRRLTVGLILFLLSGLAIHHQLADWEHLMIFPWGYLTGRVFRTPPIRPRSTARVRAGYLVAFSCLTVVGLAGTVHALPPPPVYRAASGAPLSPPRVVETSYPTPALGGSRPVLVLLPAGYDSNPSARYPVVELLHGDPGAPASLVSLGDLSAAQAASGIQPFIGVAPDGNDATKPFSWWANIPGHAMGTAVTSDLRAWAATHLRITGSWSFAGLSSGGFAAAYLPLISTQPVHAICALSGYFDGKIPVTQHLGPAAIRTASALAGIKREPSLVFVAYGLADRRIAKGSALFVQALERAHRRVIVLRAPGAHNWSVWKPAFVACFRTILPSSAQ